MVIQINYYISDLHLFHKNVLKNGRFKERPFETLEEMHKTIKRNWNNKVTNADHVYILGDVAYLGYVEEVSEYLSDLKGNLHCIKGNHDDFRDYRLRRQFEEICDYKEITDNFDGKNHNLVLSHYPLFVWKGQNRGTIHLYGHVHDNFDDEIYQRAIAELDNVYRQKNKDVHKSILAVNVGCMRWNYTPVSLAEILEEYKKIIDHG